MSATSSLGAGDYYSDGTADYGSAQVAGVAVSLYSVPPLQAPTSVRVVNLGPAARGSRRPLTRGRSTCSLGMLRTALLNEPLHLMIPIPQVIRWLGPKLGGTRIMPFFVSLLVANVLQAIGTLINGRWVSDRNVVAGPLCSAQGGIKQAGNVGMALWYTLSSFILCAHLRAHVYRVPRYRSFALSLHVFMLLFVRRLTLSALHCWVLLISGWFLVAFVVAIGPTAIQSPARGSYFGPTGFW